MFSSNSRLNRNHLCSLCVFLVVLEMTCDISDIIHSVPLGREASSVDLLLSFIIKCASFSKS